MADLTQYGEFDVPGTVKMTAQFQLSLSKSVARVNELLCPEKMH